MYNPVSATKEQINKLLKKHLFPRAVINSKITYDSEDNIHFYYANTITGKTIECQVRQGEPMFLSFSGFGSTRYDINYLNEYPKLHKRIKDLTNKYIKAFWKGSEI